MEVKAAIVSPPLNDSGIPQVHAVPEWDDLPTEDEARDYMMREAKKWIDENPLDETSLYRQ